MKDEKMKSFSYIFSLSSHLMNLFTIIENKERKLVVVRLKEVEEVFARKNEVLKEKSISFPFRIFTPHSISLSRFLQFWRQTSDIEQRVEKITHNNFLFFLSAVLSNIKFIIYFPFLVYKKHTRLD